MRQVPSQMSDLKEPDHFFLLQKWIQLSHMSQVANFWFSSHNFGNIEIFGLQLLRHNSD